MKASVAGGASDACCPKNRGANLFYLLSVTVSLLLCAQKGKLVRPFKVCFNCNICDPSLVGLLADFMG